MPELPEVESMRRAAANVIGGRIERFERVPCLRRPIAIAPRIDQFRKRVVGRQVSDAIRIGKRVALELDGGDLIVIEPRMTGRVMLVEPRSKSEYLRLRIGFSGEEKPTLWYWDQRGLGQICFVRRDEREERFGRGKIGPDALAISVDELIGAASGSGRAIKVALLDQRVVAGVGNLYAAEILHEARIDPQQSCDSLGKPAWKRIHTAMRDILHQAVERRGSTLDDDGYRDPYDEPGEFAEFCRVYDREEKPCVRCKREKIVRIVQAQRSTFYCPRCQRRT